jgi:hypothetical protein
VLELLEDRLVLSLPSDLVIRLGPGDGLGDQIVTVQAYQGSARTTYGIFDTGASAITFSAADQAAFTARGLPIPIKVPGGALAAGVGGTIVGDVSQPAPVLADGLHAASLSYDESGLPVFTATFGPDSANVPGVQAFVGTPAGSPELPTITGTPILTGGRAALIDMSGASFDFSQSIPGLSVNLPDLHFVSAGYQLQGGAGTLDPVKVPISLVGPDSHGNPARGVTEAPNPVQSNVRVTVNGLAAGGKRFLFDTGAQMTVISPRLAAQLGLDLLHPPGTMSVQAVAGQDALPSFTVDDLTLPRTDGGTLSFMDVPLVVADCGSGLDGILGMNLFNTAIKLLYDPYGGSTVSLLFPGAPTHGNYVPPATANQLSQLGVPFASKYTGTSLPAFSVASGQVSGQVFLDYNDDGYPSAAEPGVAGQTVYLDTNGNGVLDLGEPSAVTDEGGNYAFNGLLPGTYTLRQVVASGLVQMNPLGTGYDLTVSTGTNSGGWNFADATQVPNELTAYVTGLYGTLLDRPPDNFGLNLWTSALQQGLPRQAVAQAVWESPEHRGQEVDRYYALYLHRVADPGGRALFISAFQAGASELDVQQAILSSSEYQSAHVDNASFVNGLYVDVLGRTADAGGLAFWLQVLARKSSRDAVIRGFLTSDEAYVQVLNRYYQDYLHRPFDDVGQHAWLGLLDSGQYTLESVGTGFLTSEEYKALQRLRIG